MVDFKKLLEKRQQETGYCYLPNNRYASLTGTRTHFVTEQSEQLSIYWLVEDDEKPVLRFLNGVTGAEAYYIDHLFRTLENCQTEEFCLCAGTEGRWDRLTIAVGDLRQILEQYRIFHDRRSP